MMRIAPCRPYHSRTERTGLLRLPDGRSVFKVYYISIIGRDNPAAYEWPHCPLTYAGVEAALASCGLEGVGFITAFPHILKVFRFAPSMETVLHVRAVATATLAPLDLVREDGYTEFACYAEAAIAAEEYHAWAQAEDVAAYLQFFSQFHQGPIRQHGKLAAYLADMIQ